jgi:hypothetical protein
MNERLRSSSNTLSATVLGESLHLTSRICILLCLMNFSNEQTSKVKCYLILELIISHLPLN